VINPGVPRAAEAGRGSHGPAVAAAGAAAQGAGAPRAGDGSAQYRREGECRIGLRPLQLKSLRFGLSFRVLDRCIGPRDSRVLSWVGRGHGNSGRRFLLPYHDEGSLLSAGSSGV
jgi:hypothetical protein